MGLKLFFQLTAITLLPICIAGGCIFNDNSTTCSQAECYDTLTVKILPSDSWLSGRYSAELSFSDDVSIFAEFELIPVEGSTNVTVRIIENESYPTSWSMHDEFVDVLEIFYSGIIRIDGSLLNYEFNEELTINITRDSELILSELIAPDYDYYWCNKEYGKCDDRQNKMAEIEVVID